MPTFRKKPVEVEALQFDGCNHAEVHAFVGDSAHGDPQGRPDHLIIRTLEGDHLAGPGDFIIRGVQGEFYPCKPEIFEATYDEAA